MACTYTFVYMFQKQTKAYTLYCTIGIFSYQFGHFGIFFKVWYVDFCFRILSVIGLSFNEWNIIFDRGVC